MSGDTVHMVKEKESIETPPSSSSSSLTYSLRQLCCDIWLFLCICVHNRTIYSNTGNEHLCFIKDKLQKQIWKSIVHYVENHKCEPEHETWVKQEKQTPTGMIRIALYFYWHDLFYWIGNYPTWAASYAFIWLCIYLWCTTTQFVLVLFIYHLYRLLD